MPTHASLGQKIVSVVAGVFVVAMLLLMLFPIIGIVIFSYTKESKHGKSV
jgi:ABC-type spermidine/putrescine transport system permease subunit II